MPMRTRLIPLLAALGLLLTSPVRALQIIIDPGDGLFGNSAALAAFDRAASRWETRISDNIIVTIDADLIGGFNSNVIGSASSVLLGGDYDLIRDQMVMDAADETDDGIVAFLPTSGQFRAMLPDYFSLSGFLVGSKANLKAVGFSGLDSDFGPSDGTIEFNSSFSFDFDNSDGVGSGQMDFETVAAHEIGHTLGFISMVDSVDQIIDGGLPPEGIGLSIGMLDLFRFGDDTADDPATDGEFRTNARDLRPSVNAIFDDLDDEYDMSTGAFTGDGRQASHWKDGQDIGLMDPTLAFGEVIEISEADFRALDLIGYDIAAIPLPAGVWFFLSGMGVLLARNTRRRRSAAQN